jgi:hypothetical protein
MAKRRIIKCEIVAIHEAGHAVARFMTAPLMGYEPSDALVRVEMFRPYAVNFIGTDGRPRYEGGKTYGPWFSKEIEAAAVGITYNSLEMSLDDMRPVIAAARAAGADVNGWTYAKVLQAIAGPAAEAKATGRPFYGVLAECEGDNVHASLPCCAVGMSQGEAATLVAEALAHLKAEFAKPAVWNGLVTLAAALPREGRMQGCDCWAVYSSAL